jgi:hypothetical protein
MSKCGHMAKRVIVVGVVSALALFTTAIAAFANTSNPTSINVVINGNQVTVSGTWQWPHSPGGQNCLGRYGTGVAISWWGIGASQTPSNNVTLTNMSQITDTGQGENGTAPTSGTGNSTGALKFDNNSSNSPFQNQFFYVGKYYADQEIFTSDFCHTAQPNDSTTTFGGTYTATATYPSADDIPSTICVVTYDEHGSSGKPSGGAGPLQTDQNGVKTGDFNPAKDGDNSIQQHQFSFETNCTTNHTEVPVGTIGIIGTAVLVAGVFGFMQWRRRRGRGRTPAVVA